MRRLYIHQRPDWPDLHWRDADLLTLLAEVRYQQGRLLGRVEDLGFDARADAFPSAPDSAEWLTQERLIRSQLRNEASLSALTDAAWGAPWRLVGSQFYNETSLAALTNEVMKSSEIEGEILNREQVRSAIARRLGTASGGINPSDKNSDGMVHLMVDATRNYARRITADRLFGWHRALFPDGRDEFGQPITVGNWRNGEMGVVGNGRFGREIVHFEAPQASVLNQEMQTFLDWCNKPTEVDPVLKAGQAHLWFVTIHPFDDGNGRIARAIADLMLARADHAKQRFYSISSQIMQECEDYYLALETAQKGTTDITEWLKWFLECLGRAIDDAYQKVSAALAKARLWERLAGLNLNARQRRLINTLFDGFNGKFTAGKWAKIAKCSIAVAQQDIDHLIANDVLYLNPAHGPRPDYLLVGDRRVPRQMRRTPVKGSPILLPG